MGFKNPPINMTLSSQASVRSFFPHIVFATLDTPSIKIDINDTVVVDGGQLHCIFLDKVITGKVLLSH